MTSVHVAGLGHGSIPIPAASRVGPLVATGGIRGVDRATGVMPEGLEEQVALMFANLRAVIEAAGGCVESIVKVTVFAPDRGVRDALNTEWVAMFPDPDARPARHLLELPLPGGMRVQCEALAYIEDRHEDRHEEGKNA